MIIRRVTEEDAGAYAACHIVCWQAAYRGIMTDEYLDITLPSVFTVERCKKNLAEPGGRLFYCAEEDGEMIGRLIFGKCHEEGLADTGEIDAIYLLPEFWDRGYGKGMMEFAKDALRQMGYRQIILWVLKDNRRARRFYEKSGFVFDGTEKEITIGKPLAELRYVCSLLQ